MTTNETSEGMRWLLLIHQLPAKPAYARVKESQVKGAHARRQLTDLVSLVQASRLFFDS